MAAIQPIPPHIRLQEMAATGPSENLDRISSLPKEVIDEILIRLPIRDAVRTCFLSTNWRRKWNSIPHLVFDKNSILSTRNSDQVKFVDCALLLHNGVISKFKMVKYLDICYSDAERWMVVLSTKGLQHLVLSFKKGGEIYKAPTTLFKCEFLRILRLSFCMLRLPSPFNGLSHLTDLELLYVTITNETFQNLVVNLPLLGTLKLVNCRLLNYINVRAPYLKEVYIYGGFTAINFHNSPNIISLYLYPGGSRVQSFEDIISEQDQLQIVDVTYPRIKNFALDAAWVDSHAIYRNLTSATFRVNCRDPVQILSVILLCRSSPSLEKLEIADPGNFSYGVTFEESFWNGRLRKEKVFHHLKCVRLGGFTGMDIQLGLAQFILMNALVLETLDISWKESFLTDSEKLQQVVKMTKFERASSNAKVIFCD